MDGTKIPRNQEASFQVRQAKEQLVVASAIVGLALAIIGALTALSYTSTSKLNLQYVKLITGITCFSTGVTVSLLSLRNIIRENEKISEVQETSESEDSN